MGTVRITSPGFLGPHHIFGMGESRHFKFRVKIDTDKYQHMHDKLPPKGMCSGSRNLFNFF